jgi:hypothetical protein
VVLEKQFYLELQFFQIHRKEIGDYVHNTSTASQQTSSSNTNNKQSQQNENADIPNIRGTVFDSVIIKLKSLIEEMQSTVVNFMSRGFKENTKLYLNKKYCFFS